MELESLAAICHEANRRYCKETGDASQKSWEECPWWQKQSALAGVIFVLKHPEAELGALHAEWMARKVEEGWTYGEEKSEDARKHPCILPYGQLPELQKVKDALFKNVVLALANQVEGV